MSWCFLSFFLTCICPGCRPSACTQSSPRGPAGTAEKMSRHSGGEVWEVGGQGSWRCAGGGQAGSLACCQVAQPGRCLGSQPELPQQARGQTLLSWGSGRAELPPPPAPPTHHTTHTAPHLGMDAAAPADDACEAVRCEGDVAQQQACVDREVVHALLRLLDQRVPDGRKGGRGEGEGSRGGAAACVCGGAAAEGQQTGSRSGRPAGHQPRARHGTAQHSAARRRRSTARRA